MKKHAFIFLAALFWLAGCSNSHAFRLNKYDRADVAKEEQISFKIGIALDGAGSGHDDFFNGIGWEGLAQYVKRYPATKFQSAAAKGDNDEDRKQAVRELALIKSDIIFGFGASYAAAFEELHMEYPNIKFVLLGEKIEPRGDNLTTVVFHDQQSSFLAGAAAALTSDTNKVAFLGGKETEESKRQQLGFEAGIKYANRHLGASAILKPAVYVGNYFEQKKCRQLAKELYGGGADVIYCCAKMAGMGAMDEAKLLGEKGKSVWLVGADSDLHRKGYVSDGASVILTSTMKRLDFAIYEILQLYVHGHFPSGQHLDKTMENFGVGLPAKNPNFSEKGMAAIKELERQLQEGELEIPYQVKELERFAAS